MGISVIVPVYNVQPYLHRCVDSVLAQTYTDWELILVDDGSPDRCPVICDEYAAKDNRIRVIHKENGGLSDARNCGLDIATGDFVMFLDSDDYIHHNMLMTMYRLCVDEGADIVQCAYVRGTSDVFPVIEERVSHSRFDGCSILGSPKQQVILCAKLYRRTLWEGIRMPVGLIHEDEATTWRLYYRSRCVVVIDTPYYYYYKNPYGIMGREARRFSPVFVKCYEERISFFHQQGEHQLALLSSWRFCLPLMYIYLRGSLTEDEEERVYRLLRKHIPLFANCRQVPLAHRVVFVVLGLCPRFLRKLSVMLGKASTIK